MLEDENDHLNLDFKKSFKPNDNTGLEEMINYRQVLVNKICQNNDELKGLHRNLIKQEKIIEFLLKCFYYINNF